ncbi:MAG: pirin family protein [Tannerellaceae bacterium]|jgi:redox-sensitive bicupin YhaK (pirin superfamily)|nr:pirin family protein [Tannerellaceae bacterium]
MKTIFYKANTRGHANHGWLNTYHTFSFADYCDSERVHFGALRVLNDDIVTGGTGFGPHPHDNMEIVTIPLKGAVRHGDNLGNSGVIHEGDIQVMSAGTGIVHSEYNADNTTPVNFFQIWIFPDKKDVKPRYEQKQMDYLRHRNSFTELVAPTPSPNTLWLHQRAWLSIGAFDCDKECVYNIKAPNNAVFAMNIQGKINIGGIDTDTRDGLGLWETSSVAIKALSDDARILIIDIPLSW